MPSPASMAARAERITFTQISMEIVDDNRYRPHMEPEKIHIFPVCIFLGKRTPESLLGRVRDDSKGGR